MLEQSIYEYAPITDRGEQPKANVRMFVINKEKKKHTNTQSLESSTLDKNESIEPIKKYEIFTKYKKF